MLREMTGSREERTKVRSSTAQLSHHDGACCTLVNETSGLRLVLDLLPKVSHFNGDDVLRYVGPRPKSGRP